MQRLLYIIALLAMAIVAKAQLTITTSGTYVELTQNVIDVDRVILFDHVASATLTYNASNVQWYNHQGQLVSSSPTIQPSDATGYTIRVNGSKVMFIWVIDYSNYLWSNGTLEVDEGADPCQSITLHAAFTQSTPVYGDSLGGMHQLARTYMIGYDDYVYVSDTVGWVYQRKDSLVMSLPGNIYTKSPRADTRYGLFGDNYAIQLGLPIDTLFVDYTAVAVDATLTATVVERDGLNEVNRSEQNEVGGSAPLVVEFKANSNTPTATYHEWKIYNVDHPESVIRYTDEQFQFTFAETGGYNVVMEVSNGGPCKILDSINVNVRDSFIEIPNVFTPNGDGVNDEFRVAYRSIKEFSMKVLNRWGVVVFTSNDPNKGWDGKINGRPAAEGTYFYVIEAYGTDKDSRGRVMKYKKAGDINLLR